MSGSSDSEYDSEDDEDYIPVEPSSEEENIVVLEGTDNKTTKEGKKGQKQKTRKRKRGIQLEDDNDEVSDHEESEDDGIEPEPQEKEDSTSKRRVDDLWEAFKRDTAAVRPATSSSVKQSKEQKVEDEKEETSLTCAVLQKEKNPKKVEITEIFDFAGEEVKVVKSVDATSIKPVSSSDVDKTVIKPKAVISTKRPGGGLGGVLGKIGKKPKLSTLEKSKLDWNSFKKDEGIEDELKSSNRDGYLEKQAFLTRVDYNQFEIERDVRQGSRKK